MSAFLIKKLKFKSISIKKKKKQLSDLRFFSPLFDFIQLLVITKSKANA